MSRSVNKVILVGNLGRDAETKFTSGGNAKTTFSVATSNRYKNAEGEWVEDTQWHNVVLWRQEKLGEYLKKGTTVYVEGRLQTRSYEKNESKVYVTEVVGNEVILLGGRRDEERSAPRSESRAAAQDDWSEDRAPF